MRPTGIGRVRVGRGLVPAGHAPGHAPGHPVSEEVGPSRAHLLAYPLSPISQSPHVCEAS